MRNPPTLSGARRSLLKGMVVAAIAYLLVTAVAAIATPLFSGKDPAFAVWLGGGLMLLVAVVRLANRSLSASIRVKRAAGSLLLGLGVTGVTVFISFVVMVNIWERLGLGH